MRRHALACAVLLALAGLASAGGAVAQTIHPPTREGAGAKPDSAESQSGRAPASQGGHRPEAQGGADSQQNRDYGKETQPTGQQLQEGQPAAPRP